MSGKAKPRFASLDCLRGLFASMVVFHHMVDYTSSPVIHNNFFRYSNLFVDFFFVLSGFVISYSYSSFPTGESLRRFYKKRLLRLYPLHVCLLLVFVLFEFAKYFSAAYIQFNGGMFAENNLLSFLSSLLLLNSVKWPHIYSLSWNYTSWSISAEVISYFTYSLIVFSLFRLRKQAYQNLIFLFLIFIGFGVLYFLHGNLNLIYTYDYGFLRGLIGFSAGVLCFGVYKGIHQNGQHLPALLFTALECLALLLTFVLVWNWERFQTAGYVYIILFFFSVLVFAFEKGHVSRFLASVPFFLNLGTYSYSIYMNHAIIGILFNVFFIRILKLPETVYAYLALLNFLVVYFVSRWTFYNIELRFQKRISHRLEKVLVAEDQKFSF